MICSLPTWSWKLKAISKAMLFLSYRFFVWLHKSCTCVNFSLHIMFGLVKSFKNLKHYFICAIVKLQSNQVFFYQELLPSISVTVSIAGFLLWNLRRTCHFSIYINQYYTVDFCFPCVYGVSYREACIIVRDRSSIYITINTHLICHLYWYVHSIINLAVYL